MYNRIMYHNMIQVCHFSFCDFCINSTNYVSLYCQISREMSSVLFTHRQTETVTFCNRSIQYYQQPEVAELPLHALEIHDSGPQFIVQKSSVSQKLKLLKFCSFRNFTHIPTHATEYLILTHLNYLNTL